MHAYIDTYLCIENKVALQYIHVHGYEAKLQGIHTYKDELE